MVCDDAEVTEPPGSGRRRVYDHAEVCGSAGSAAPRSAGTPGLRQRRDLHTLVCGNAKICDNARSSVTPGLRPRRIFGKVKIFGRATVCGRASVTDDAKVSGDAWVGGDAWVFGDAEISGDTRIDE